MERSRTLISDIDLTTTRARMLYWGMFMMLLVGAFTTLLPLVWGFASALKPPSEIFGYPPTFLPSPATRPWEWNWSVYGEVFASSQFLRYFWNTFLLAVCCWAAAIFPSALAGYALSKLQVPFRAALLLLFFTTLMVPFQTYLVPLFLTVRDLPVGVTVTDGGLSLVRVNLMQIFAGYPAVILPAGVSAINIFLFKNFFDEIPTALVEAGRIDGCSEVGILVRIVIPLSYAVFAVVSIFSFMATWNDFLWPLLTISDNRWHTIMLHLYAFDNQGDIGKNKVLAALMIASVPPLVLFALFQKRIMQGIAMTGVKF